MAQILFTDVRPHDVLIEDGRIVPLERRTEGCEVVEAGGLLALPAPVDAHVHPDKTTWGQPWLSRTPARTLRDLIEGDVAARAEMATPVAERAGALMDHAIARGTRAWRAHVDVAPVYGLANVHGVREAAQAREGLLNVQIVAFPQLGLLSMPGTAELMEQSLKEGADILGGLDPVGVDGDLHGHLDLLYGMAERHAVPVDIHLHDGGEQGVAQVLEIARRAKSSGVPTTISHAFCLADREDLAETLAEAKVALTTCALGADPVLPVGPLLEAGVLVGLGSDGVRDPWTPFGDGDMINRAHLLAYRTDARTDEELAACYEIAAHGGAALLGLERVRLRPGDPADFLLVRAESVVQAVVDKSIPQFVVRNGRVRERSY
ncbi:amidohydrolase family protein [Streptosporangium roseum]|uniref:N-isopropylammelide isopropylaminohydrolase n=1 Tax=Streptosporangium roseum (strain ATCC 12428 / DSM 43021 / JCM 3005 / KCTC 9067 / NCIMB 10171 / NRRL 2505 / NI 9100) TaxID=479432 RepID=D2B6S7_STRRD|nr:amidohydrolase family protein [Streptosporangium roseum]ACZ87665.1 N-isopropylammelide isopropylaminohydrolase [Streptosporangium roseum DSM 43021]